MKKVAGPILEISNLYKKVKNKTVERLNISILSGNTFAVLHKNSDNIELLTDIISGRIKTEKGKIFFKGDDVTGIRNVFGVIERKPEIPKLKTVSDFAALPVVKRGLSRNMAEVLVKKELSSFSLSEYGDKNCGKLPKNIALRAELFSAYMCSHELIVIDEPFGILNKDERMKEIEWFGCIKEKLNISLLFFTQDIDIALKLADTIMVVNDRTESVGIVSLDKKAMEKSSRKVKELYDTV